MTFRLYPPVWFLTLVCLQIVLVRNLPSLLHLPTWLQHGGVVIGVIGLGVMVAALRAFRIHHTTVLPFENTSERLIESGVFRLSRNPVYLGEAIMLAGIALRSGQLWPWVALPVFIIGINRSVIAWEERTLRDRFGDQFEHYCRRTRRWL